MSEKIPKISEEPINNSEDALESANELSDALLYIQKNIREFETQIENSTRVREELQNAIDEFKGKHGESAFKSPLKELLDSALETQEETQKMLDDYVEKVNQLKENYGNLAEIFDAALHDLGEVVKEGGPQASERSDLH